MTKAPGSTISGVHWADEDVVTMLCTLNFRIEGIRSAMEDDQKSGLNYATQLLSEAVGNGCTPARVKRKIQLLWDNQGDYDGGKEPYDVYQYGAFSKTLPALRPDQLSKIAVRVKKMQRDLNTSTNPPRTPTPIHLPGDVLRRSRRIAVGNDFNDPVNCRCGFTHNILWVHCGGCSTWHHAYCYYNTEDKSKLPATHLCQDCDTKDEDSLIRAIQQIRIHQEEIEEKRKGFIEKSAKAAMPSNTDHQLGPFGLPIDEEVMWGPEDDEIRNTMSLIGMHLQSVANSLEPGLNISKACFSDPNSPDTSLLVRTALGIDEWSQLRPEFVDPPTNRRKRRQLLRAVLAVALRVWIFDTPEPPPSYNSVLLSHYQKVVLKKNGLRVLGNLHRSALILMMDEVSPLQDVIKREAEQLADRCLNAILPITFPRELCRSSTQDDRVVSSEQVLGRRSGLIHAFSSAIKLKHFLPLTQKYSEFYSPPPGFSTSDGLAVLDDGSTVGGNELVALCLMPAVVEYPPSLFSSQALGNSLCGENNIVQASDEQRKKGRVVSPAVVSVA